MGTVAGTVLGFVSAVRTAVHIVSRLSVGLPDTNEVSQVAQFLKFGRLPNGSFHFQWQLIHRKFSPRSRMHHMAGLRSDIVANLN
jgi:hypothetical protein